MDELSKKCYDVIVGKLKGLKITCIRKLALLVIWGAALQHCCGAIGENRY